MPNRLSYDCVKERFESKGDILVSQNYLNNATPLKIQCGECNDKYELTYASFSQGNRHPRCPKRETQPKNFRKEKGKRTSYKPVIFKKCKYCKKFFTNKKYPKQIVCNINCKKGWEKEKAKTGHYKK